MKVLEDLMREVDNVIKRRAPQASRKYNKITHSLRIQFLDKIIFENKSIKKAAEEMNINYSSAKSILTSYRRKQRNNQQIEKPDCTCGGSIISNPNIENEHAQVCKFREKKLKDQITSQNFQIISSLGGKVLSCQDLSIQQKIFNMIRLNQMMNNAYFQPSLANQINFI